MKHVYDVGNKIFELMTELFENFSDADNFILTPHGIKIVNEIADCAENTYEFGMAKKENKEIFKKAGKSDSKKYMVLSIKPSIKNVSWSILRLSQHYNCYANFARTDVQRNVVNISRRA